MQEMGSLTERWRENRWAAWLYEKNDSSQIICSIQIAYLNMANKQTTLRLANLELSSDVDAKLEISLMGPSKTVKIMCFMWHFFLLGVAGRFQEQIRF